jgi:hypothetical protein
MRAEDNVRMQDMTEDEKLEYWYAVSRDEMAHFESGLVGVA